MKKYNFSFYKNKMRFFAASLLLLLIGVVFNFIFGTKLDMQFTGGALLQYSYEGSLNEDEVKNIVESQTGKSVEMRLNKSLEAYMPNSVSFAFAGTETISLETQENITNALNEKYEEGCWNIWETNSIDPSMGQTFFLKCLLCVGLAFLFLILYIALRFKKIGGIPAGVMAIVALLHDVLFVYFTFIVFKVPLNDNFIAVILTILGYSLNDTIVIYDRIRKNRTILGPKEDLENLVDLSINQTLGRSINTSVSTFISITVVYVIGLMYNLPTITTFALPMMIGVVAGCYSSVCIAGPLYVMWYKHKTKEKKKVKNAEPEQIEEEVEEETQVEEK